jgi:uncharacterized protein YfaT (DUF1175 family)
MFVPQLEPPTGPLPIMVRRVAIAQAALKKFQGVGFKWGDADCAKLALFVAKTAGHRVSLSRFGNYASERTARRALKAEGLSSMVEAVDSFKVLKRIAPLAALPGDLIAFPGSEDGWDSITVALGNSRVLGFTEQAERGACSIIQAKITLALAAWSVMPWRK